MTCTPDPASEQQARLEAAEWLTKHDRGLTAVEQDEFFQWLSSDPRHGAWFAVHRKNWQRLDGITDWRPQHGSEPNPDVLARPSALTRARRSALVIAAAGILVVVLGFLGFREFAPSRTEPEAGGYESRLFEDGTLVELNRGAEIEVNFTINERRVVLRHGEAFFTVAKDAQRPFIVSANGAQIRAVGTAFNVMFDRGAVEVLVMEGKVAVAPPPAAVRKAETPAAPPLVVAGERAMVSLAHDVPPRIAPASADQMARIRAWQPQLLDFSSVPLEKAMEEFNRRNRVKLVLADSSRGQIPIVASIRSDNIEGFVSLVAAAAGLTAERRGSYEIVLHAAK